MKIIKKQGFVIEGKKGGCALSIIEKENIKFILYCMLGKETKTYIICEYASRKIEDMPQEQKKELKATIEKIVKIANLELSLKAAFGKYTSNIFKNEIMNLKRVIESNIEIYKQRTIPAKSTIKLLKYDEDIEKITIDHFSSDNVIFLYDLYKQRQAEFDEDFNSFVEKTEQNNVAYNIHISTKEKDLMQITLSLKEIEGLLYQKGVF